MIELIFDYNEGIDSFIGKFPCFLDPYDFNERSRYLSKNFKIFYSKKYKGYVIKKAFFDYAYNLMLKKGVKLNMTEKAKENFKYSFKTETVYFRGNSLNEEVVSDNIILKDFQKDIINYHLDRSNVLNTISAGLGKTGVTAVSHADHFFKNKINGIFCIVLNSHQYHWKREFLNFTKNIFKEEDFYLVTNENKDGLFEVEEIKEKKVIILPEHLLGSVIGYYTIDKKNNDDIDKNIESLKNEIKRDVGTLKAGKGNKKNLENNISNLKKKIEACKKEKLNLKDYDWKNFSLDIKKLWGKNNVALIIDEAHKFKYSNTVKSQALNSIISNFNFKTFLTATPSQNGFEHIYNLINMLDKSIINKGYYSFISDIASDLGNKFNPYSINQYDEAAVSTYLDRFRNTVLIKKNKEEIPELKFKKIVEPLFVEMTPLQKRLYELVCIEELKKIEEKEGVITYRNLQNKFHRISYTIDNPSLLKDLENFSIKEVLKQWKDGDNPKFEMLDSLINEVVDEDKDKIVVFANNPKTLDFLFKKYKKYNPIVIHGRLSQDSPELREEKRLEFMDSKSSCKIAFLSSYTSSAGGNWNITNRMVVLEIPFDGIAWEQMINRTDRVNSVKDSIINPIIMDNTIDGFFYERNQNRVEFNRNLDKPLDLKTLRKLLNGY